MTKASEFAPIEFTATVPAMLSVRTEEFAKREFIKGNSKKLTFEDLEQESAALARGLLAAGAGKGTRIGILLPNGPDWAAVFLSIIRIGAIAVPISTFCKARELAHVIRHADINTLLVADRYLSHDYVARLEEAFPALLELDGKPLYFPDAPFLRAIWVSSATPPRWSSGNLADLIWRGRSEGRRAEWSLAAVEDNVVPADIALMIYTSGSTSDPKGVVHTHGTLVQHVISLNRMDTDEEGDRICVATPFFWIGGLLNLMGTLNQGGTIICPESPDPDVLLDTVRREKATRLSGWANQLLSVMDSPNFASDDFARLKPVSVTQAWLLNKDPTIPRERFPNSLGMTETFGPHSGEQRGTLLPLGYEGSFGRGLPGIERKIVEPETGKEVTLGEKGELCVRGYSLMQGFYKKERHEVFDADGFFHTGDGCRINADGYLFFDGRLGEMIKTVGANVAPSEVELVLKTFPEIIDAAVLGLPDPRLGEVVVAAVVLKQGLRLGEAEIQERLKQELSSYKVPKHIFFFDFEALPRTESAKVRKHLLKPMLAEKIAGKR